MKKANRTEKHIPLFGTVSHDGGLFTLHFMKTGHESRINRIGYGPEIFKSHSIPIIRFDLGPLENVLECIKGEVVEIVEYYQICNWPWSKPITLAAYLEDIQKKGVPVETGYHEKGDLMKIIECTVGPYPRAMPEGMLDKMPEVKVVFEDGTEKTLFQFYPDEISFSKAEFIGLTEEEAFRLRHRKDVAYLQS